MRGYTIETPTMDCDKDGEINMSLDVLCIKQKIAYYKCNYDGICQNRETVLTCYNDCSYKCEGKRIGDSDCNGIIEIDDLYAIQNFVFGRVNKTDTMDCNNDSVVNIFDIMCIKPMLECNKNGTCDINETYEKCPSDCIIGDQNRDSAIETREIPYLVRTWKKLKVPLRHIIHALILWKTRYAT